MIETSSSYQLAVVIPAYKGDFLTKALACLARQTDQRFNLYICDDTSPADIEGIARSALGGRAYTYKRFEKNLGGVSLAKNWNRCVTLTKEPWIWLFSDDDLMDDNCVAEFHKFLETDGELVDIVRFDTWVVDEQDKIVDLHTPPLDAESWLEYTYGLLMNWRRTVMQQIVFRRSVFEKAGGFLDLPMAWGTDNAAIIAFGKYQKIRRIPSGRVLWRNSGQNITPDRSVGARRRKLQASCMFLHWLQGQLQKPREQLFEGDHDLFQRAMDRFLMEQIGNEGSLATLANWRLLASTRVEVCGGSRFSLLKYVVQTAVNDGISGLGRIMKMLAGRSIRPTSVQK